MAKAEPEKKKAPAKKSKPAKTLAILARSRRTGRWRLAKNSNVLALLGTVHLDMRKSFTDDENLQMKVTVLFGSATFILPFGAEVKPSGTSILAVSVVDVPEHDDVSELPTLDIEWTAVFGRLRIVTDPLVEEPAQQVIMVAAPAPVIAAPVDPPVTAVTEAEPVAATPPERGPEPVATPEPAVATDDAQNRRAEDQLEAEAV